MPDRYTFFICLYTFIYLRPASISAINWSMADERSFLLFKQDVQFLFTLCVMLGRHVGALHFLTHVIDFQCKDRKPVYGPCRTFGVNRCIGLYFLHLYICQGNSCQSVPPNQYGLDWTCRYGVSVPMLPPGQSAGRE